MLQLHVKRYFFWMVVCAGAISALPAIAQVDSLPDSQVYDNAIEQAANNCLDYSGTLAKPQMHKINIFALRMAAQRQVLICPNQKLSAAGPAVIWYGNHKAMVWNPAVSGAFDTMNAQLVSMAKDDSYPSSITTWDANGKELKDQTVPMFELSPTSTLVH